MTTEEMQRFLDYQASEGKNKQQALEALAVKFSEPREKADQKRF